jgi:hypothetical protein
MGIVSKIAGFFINIYIFAWDNVLFVVNLLTPSLKPGHVVPRGCPGHGGEWPEFVPPKDGDSRSACPALNALANHGILPHDGKNISFKEMNEKVRQSYNFAPTFCFFVPKYAADFLDRSYWSGRFDLADLSQHNAIEHDASLTRRDFALQPDQGLPDQQLVDDLLADATGTEADGSPRLTKPDLSRALSKRFVDAQKTNKDYSMSLIHKVFGASKYVFMFYSTLLIFKLVDDADHLRGVHRRPHPDPQGRAHPRRLGAARALALWVDHLQVPVHRPPRPAGRRHEQGRKGRGGRHGQGRRRRGPRPRGSRLGGVARASEFQSRRVWAQIEQGGVLSRG